MSGFKIAAAQVPSVRGDVAGNIGRHTAAVTAAAGQGVAVLVFPELSLTGYEPELAAELAVTPADEALGPLAELARRHRMDIVVGAPLRNPGAEPGLGAILFTADGPPRAYAKMHLGGSEPRYFSAGRTPLAFAARGQVVGVAICADSSQPAHPRGYAEGGATVYAAGVFLNAEWYATDSPRLAEYASRFRLLVVMANHAASMGTHASVGKSAVWAPGGELLAEAPGTETCLVVATRGSEGWGGEVVRL
jgi:predicted amidohydrolase